MHIDRRLFLRGLGAAALSQLACTDPIPSPTPVPPPGTGLQTAQVNITQLAQAATQQQCEQWCWAASISTIFNFYNHPLTQQQIVVATYGNVFCLPANTTTTIGRDLSRLYIDNRGVRFSSRVISAYDYFNRINTFNNQLIVDALSNNNPLLYCNTHHAMVVYSVTYLPTPFGPDVRAVNVVDPWPFSPITHALTASEMVVADFGGEMTFLAQVQTS